VPSLPPIPDMTARLNQIYESVPKLQSPFPTMNTMKSAYSSMDLMFSTDAKDNPEHGKKRPRSDTADLEEFIEHHNKRAHLEHEPRVTALDSSKGREPEREIKPAKSRKPKRTGLPIPITLPLNPVPIVEQITSAMTAFWARQKPLNPEQAREAQSMSAKLTAELAAAAIKTQERLASDRDMPPFERTDFFLQTPTLDSQFHQVCWSNLVPCRP
jgi:hypothetical protein